MAAAPRSRADAEALLGLAKELGCNFVAPGPLPAQRRDDARRGPARAAGLVGDPGLLDDRLVEPGHARHRAARSSPRMIARDHNRASVILWSVGNETPVLRARAPGSCARWSTTRARRTDARLVTAALEHRYVDARTRDARRPAGRGAGRPRPATSTSAGTTACPRSATTLVLAVRLRQADRRQRVRRRPCHATTQSS